MKVLHVIPSLSPTEGGPSVALPLMERALRAQGVDLTVATTNDAGPSARIDVPLGQPVEVDGSQRIYFQKQSDLYKVSWPLARWVAAHVSDFDVVHVHALFSHASVAAAQAARRRKVPYVLRPLGVLNRYGMLRRRPGLKWISFRLYERPLLRAAAAVHFTSQQERREAAELGVAGKAVVLPLGIDLEPFREASTASEFLDRWPEARERDVILYLSRLDPKKGLDILLEAFAQVRERHGRALLAIAGAGEDRLVESLRRLAARLAVSGDVLWTGHLGGSLKISAFHAARVFVLPSRSENFGIAAVEALAAGVPSVFSREVAIGEEAEAAGASLLADLEPGSVAQALSRILEDVDLAQNLSSHARALAAARFSLEGMGAALKALYQRAVNSRGVAA